MLTLTFITCLFCALLTAPPSPCVMIFASEGINPYIGAWNATCAIESRFDPFAHNSKDPNGGSFGIAQIGQLKLNEYNQANNTNYHLKDCYDVSISQKIFFWHCMKYGTDIKTACKAWNGSGPATIEYWKLVSSRL